MSNDLLSRIGANDGYGSQSAEEESPRTGAARNPIVFARDGEVFANSRDVADFFAKEHRDVLRAIDTLVANEPDLGLRNFAQGSFTLPSTGNQQHRCFDMDRRAFTVLAMGFTGPKALKWKLRYIDAFELMENELRRRPAGPLLPDFNDPVAAARAWADEAEAKRIAQTKAAQLEAVTAEMAPKVEALARIAESDGSFCITDAAKTIQVQPKALFKFLRSHGWIYTRTGSSQDVAYQSKLASGLLEHKTTTVTRSDGSEKTVTQVRVTPKGLTRLAQEFPSAVRAA